MVSRAHRRERPRLPAPCSVSARPRLLDLFCGVGGAGMGYHRAGWEVVGIDLKAQPRYPCRFYQADAMLLLRDARFLGRFDAVHASPPCQLHSAMSRINDRHLDHPELIAPTRDALLGSGKPWVIENVERAPLLDPLVICGIAMGRMAVASGREHDGDNRPAWLQRHRLFESSVPLVAPPCICKRGTRRILGVYGGGTRQWTRRGNTNGGNTDKANLAEAQALMGISWGNRTEIAQAIPPAYTELIGFQLLAALS